MATIITVHGTNAGDPDDSGEQWWQLGSDFQQNLQRLIAQPIEFVPFHWSGANSEFDRRKAARDLLGLMNKRDRAGEEIGVIGHSHGGSVLMEALRVSRLRRFPFGILRDRLKGNFKQLSFWATIGTPFINYNTLGFVRRGVRALSHLSVLFYFVVAMQVAVLTAIVGYPMVVWFFFENNAGANWGGNWLQVARRTEQLHQWWIIGTIGAAYLVAILFSLHPLLRVTKIAARLRTLRGGEKYLKTIRDAFQSNWISLRDKSDEAINALEIAQSAKTQLTPASFGGRVFSLGLGVAFATLVFAGFHAFHDYYFKHAASVFTDTSMQIHTLKDLFYFREGNFVGVGAIFFAYAYFGSVVLSPIGRWISKPLSRSIDGAISKFVRDKTLGVDLPGLAAPTVSVGPAEFDRAWAALPDDVSKAIHDYSNQFASDLLARARKALGFVHAGLGSEEILRQASDSITWRELIHTAYFDVDEFVKLLAYAICEQSSLEPSEAFLADPDFETVKAWYAAIRPGE